MAPFFGKSKAQNSALTVTQSDHDFVLSEFRRGKERAFELIFYKFYGGVCYFANNIVDDPHAAEDIVEEIFIKLWQLREDFKTFAAIKSFLYVSAKNGCLNHLRGNQIHERHHRIILPDLLDVESQNILLGEIFEAEVIRELYQAIERLPDQPRRVLSLSLQGLPTDQIAEMMGLSEQTVRNTKVRGLEKLRKRLRGFPDALALLVLLMGSHPKDASLHVNRDAAVVKQMVYHS
jgi:RNA polymerase sigma-70 factor (family 1)